MSKLLDFLKEHNLSRLQCQSCKGFVLPYAPKEYCNDYCRRISTYHDLGSFNIGKRVVDTPYRILICINEITGNVKCMIEEFFPYQPKVIYKSNDVLFSNLSCDTTTKQEIETILTFL